ncbi:LmeA family phospholipid-binding protein [Pseudonocardia sp. CA-107938]|uniref:LmeA family phospholipid-binding protein n=1 Tax=Pseudonocardia sp. CA-107938 TaxID=3240021 RepID=UPI003D9082B7
MLDGVLPGEAFYADRVEMTLGRVRIERSGARFVPAVAEQVTGVIHLTFADVATFLRQPEFLRTIMAGIDVVARLDLALANDADGGLRITGAVEILGSRFPISTSAGLRIDDGKLVVSAASLEGVPFLGALQVQPFDLVLPLRSPPGMAFTGVSTAPGEVLLEFAGTDFELRR